MMGVAVHADVLEVAGQLGKDHIAHGRVAVFEQFLHHVVAVVVLHQLQVMRCGNRGKKQTKEWEKRRNRNEATSTNSFKGIRDKLKI